MSVYRRRVMQVKHPPNQITAVYNVTSTTSQTTLYAQSLGLNYVIALYVDGQLVNPSYTGYKFAETGEHEVQIVLKKTEFISVENMFKSSNIVSVDFSELRSRLTTAKEMFSSCKSLTSVTNLDMSNVTNASSMFSGCNKLKSLDVSDWNMSKVSTLNNMFYNCYEFSE